MQRLRFRPQIRLGLAVVVTVGMLGLAGCSDSSESSGEPIIAVTYAALASVVADVVGDAARVEVVVPNGTDPHDFEPSAKDVEMLGSAAVVVANGLNLEEGLTDALAQVAKSGVPLFDIADHVKLRGADPHVWLDPSTLAQAVPALAEEIGSRIGIDLTNESKDVVASLGMLDEEIAAKISQLDSCVVITGHESLGYFGARYGCEILGAIIPSFSSAAEATAKDLADLKNLARTKGVRAVFTELGTPTGVADRLASELGVDVVEIATHLVPDVGGYGAMMRELADTIVGGLS